MQASDLLLTGGSGRLGRELIALLPGALAPNSRELDVTDADQTVRVIASSRPSVVVHCAGYTDVRGAETARERCWLVNVVGTRNVARAARETGAQLVHISTDYVFYGDRGGYREGDVPGPVRNYYSLTKLVAEEAVRALRGSLVVRTSFRPRVWPYPTAFDDLYTSQDYVDVIAPLLVELIMHLGQIEDDTLHLATERKSVYELAVRRAPEVRRASRVEAGVPLPHDVSLDVTRFCQLRAQWRQREGN
ncbi:MAG: NAD(P)-dependent oxidoreductase [Trueperaceae bacterium]|nr:NAD(P)-dependent oxidoreductase [Trueperaceae bacterium]MCC6312294.1 NAD(P)-dependent oxidoreductase [Trueperaceae bacterium]MCW5820400.1 NAD(P)-dependent oxidoreductase [Trueperaceae bacterium]